MVNVYVFEARLIKNNLVITSGCSCGTWENFVLNKLQSSNYYKIKLPGTLFHSILLAKWHIRVLRKYSWNPRCGYQILSDFKDRGRCTSSVASPHSFPLVTPHTHTYTSLWPHTESCQEDESHLAGTVSGNCAFQNSPLVQSSLMKMKAVNEAKRQWKPPFWRGQLERRGRERNKYKSQTRYSVIEPYKQCSHDKSAHLFLTF